MKINKLTQSIKSNKGFSLGEIMIVLVIIGGIMAVILPKIQDGQRKSEVNRTRMMMTEITTKLNEFYAECGRYPETLNFITDDDASCRNWAGNPKLKHLLKDAWGTEFQYSVENGGYNLVSLGRDRKEGGSSYDKDIYSDESVGGEE